MTASRSVRIEEEVLSDFAAEADHGSATLQAYLRDYPQFAEALVDLSHELSLQAALGPAAEAEGDEAWLAESWRLFTGMTTAEATDPFAALSSEATVAARRALGVPNAVFRGLRNRLVIAEDIPRGFLRRLATAIGASVEGLAAFLQGPPILAAGASHKADGQPGAAAGKISFEALLIDAQVPEDTRRALLAEAD